MGNSSTFVDYFEHVFGWTEAYLEPSRISTMDLFAKIAFLSLSIFAEKLYRRCPGSTYTSDGDADTYLGPCSTSVTEVFAKLVNNF